MRNFRNLLTPPQPISRVVGWVLAVIAAIGFVDAAFLTVQKYVGGPVPCIVTEGCDTVLSSPYASILGLPVSLYGAVFYLLVFVAAVAYLDSRREFFIRCLQVLALVGLLATLWLLYLQIFVIGAFCSYCLISAGTSLAIFFLMVYSQIVKAEVFSEKA